MDDEYLILKPLGHNFSVSDYLHGLISNLNTYKKDDKEYTLLTQNTSSIKRFKKIYESTITFEPPPRAKITISTSGSEEDYLEGLVNLIKIKLHTIDLKLYLSILIWEEKVLAKSEALNTNLQQNCILFEKVFTFIKVGYSTNYRIMVDIFGLPRDIFFGFDKVFDPKNELPIK